MTIPQVWFCLAAASGAVWAAAVLALAVGLRRLKPSPASYRPPVTVVIAARDEVTNIARCLQSLTQQDYPPDRWEVIVVDDHSRDRTAQVAANFAGRIPSLRVIPSGEPIPGLSPKKTALTAAIRLSQAEVILTTDADCVPPPTWITGMAGRFAPHISAVVGHSPLVLSPPNGAGSRISRSLSRTVARLDGFVNAVVSAGSAGLGIPLTAVGRNFAFRRRTWEDVGGYPPGASGDDDLLVQRLARRNPRAVIFTADPNTFVPAAGPATLVDWWRMKRRHLSAGRRYPLSFQMLAAALYLFNFSLAIWSVAAVVSPAWRGFLPVIYLAKAAVDASVLTAGAKRGLAGANPKWSIFPFILGEIISPLVISILVPASLVGRILWKGRTLKP